VGAVAFYVILTVVFGDAPPMTLRAVVPDGGTCAELAGKMVAEEIRMLWRHAAADRRAVAHLYRLATYLRVLRQALGRKNFDRINPRRVIPPHWQ
jgi:hypothetical protein